jgi:hypothetical protein
VQTEKDAYLLAGVLMRSGFFHRSALAARRHDLEEDVRLEMHRQQKTFGAQQTLA